MTLDYISKIDQVVELSWGEMKYLNPITPPSPHPIHTKKEMDKKMNKRVFTLLSPLWLQPAKTWSPKGALPKHTQSYNSLLIIASYKSRRNTDNYINLWKILHFNGKFAENALLKQLCKAPAHITSCNRSGFWTWKKSFLSNGGAVP